MGLHGNGKAADEAKHNINKAISNLQNTINKVSKGCDDLIENLSVPLKSAEKANIIK